MAGPNLEVFKFAFYLFFPIGVMAHFSDPEWYEEHVAPYRQAFWPDKSTLNHPPKSLEGVKSELLAMKEARARARQSLVQADSTSLEEALSRYPRNSEGQVIFPPRKEDGSYQTPEEYWPELYGAGKEEERKMTPREMRYELNGILTGSAKGKWV